MLINLNKKQNKFISLIRQHKLLSIIIIISLLIFFFRINFKVFVFFMAILIFMIIAWSAILSFIEEKITYKNPDFEISDHLPSRIKVIDIAKKSSRHQCANCKEWINEKDDFLISDKNDEIICLKCMNNSPP